MNQTEKMYLISDAAKQVKVETHVLRYWEEELHLPIKRNDLGHRFYTEEDIERFLKIRDLKNQGLQLKAIRNVLQNGSLASVLTEKEKPERVLPERALMSRNGEEDMSRHVVMVNKGEFIPMTEESREAKSLRLQQLLQNMIADAVRCNNRELCQEMKESILKELDYQFRVQEEREEERESARVSREEEHYKHIDELLRTRNRKSGGKRNKADISAPDIKNGENESQGMSEKDFLKGLWAGKKRSIN